MKNYYDQMGLFKNISEDGTNEIENKEKEFYNNLNKVSFFEDFLFLYLIINEMIEEKKSQYQKKFIFFLY